MTHRRRLQRIGGALLALALLAGCGAEAVPPTSPPEPTAVLLSDAEFAQAAQAACATLTAEVAALSELDYAGKAGAYRRAAQALAALEISDASAPQGTRLRAGLLALADAEAAFAAALDKALADAGMDPPKVLMITEDGGVFASSGSIFDVSAVSMDKAVALEMNSQAAAVREAAAALGLDECAPEKLEENK